MPSGRVKFYNTDRGYGFIAPDGGGSDVFVHVHDIEAAGMKILVAGQLVAYEVGLARDGAQRPSIFACLTRSVRNASIASPALRERCHGGLARRLVAVRWRANTRLAMRVSRCTDLLLCGRATCRKEDF